VRAAVALATLLLAGCGAGGPRFTSATPQQARRLMIRMLDRKELSYHWVACLRNGRTFRGAGIVRCNVNFGDPHIEAYCLVLRDGKLYSNHDDPAVPCRRDDAAPPATIVSS